jgi:serine/threonine protein phosphatase PrpC
MKRWRVLGASVRGDTHRRANLPNQDAIHWQQAGDGGLPLVLALSDGHGSAKSSSSQEGARLAVTTAVELLPEILSCMWSGRDPLGAQRDVAQELTRVLVSRWREKVDADYQARPSKTGDVNRYVAYGATLLCSVLTEDLVLHLQIGDGDILEVMEEDVRRPLPVDPRLIANETTSLCMDDSWREFQVVCEDISESAPSLILLASDGYANSFREDDGFLRVGRDILDIARHDGIDEVQSSLEGWLDETTREGSGDDITVGLIFRT